MSLLDRLIEGRLAATTCLPDDSALKSLPILWSFLTRIDAGVAHEKDLATISIRLGVGAWLVELTDPSLEVSCAATACTLAAVFESLETQLALPNPPIRPWKGARGQLRKKKKDGQAS